MFHEWRGECDRAGEVMKSSLLAWLVGILL